MRPLLLVLLASAACGLEESGLLESHDSGGPDVATPDVATNDVTSPTDSGTPDVVADDSPADVVEIDANDAAPDSGYDAGPILTISGGTYQLLALDSGVCSTSGSTAASFTITNDRDAAIDLVWVDYSCAEQAYGTINPNASKNQGTYVTHVWRVRNDSDKAFLAGFVLNSANAFSVTVH